MVTLEVWQCHREHVRNPLRAEGINNPLPKQAEEEPLKVSKNDSKESHGTNHRDQVGH